MANHSVSKKVLGLSCVGVLTVLSIGYLYFKEEVKDYQTKTLTDEAIKGAAVAKRQEKGAHRQWIDPVTGIEFLWVAKGCFQMGSNRGYDDEKPLHQVCLDKGYWLGKYEVTQEQWIKVMKHNPSHFKNCGSRCPVDSVSWDNVQEFIKKLNGRNKSFRLPTEAEWEYACRSGGRNENYCGIKSVDRLAWHSNNSKGKTRKVGQKQANGLGFYDMSGNVWEWVQDWYDETYYAKSPIENPIGAEPNSYRVIRGGSWFDDSARMRSSHRDRVTPSTQGESLGVRLVVDSKLPVDTLRISQLAQN